MLNSIRLLLDISISHTLGFQDRLLNSNDPIYPSQVGIQMIFSPSGTFSISTLDLKDSSPVSGNKDSYIVDARDPSMEMVI